MTEPLKVMVGPSGHYHQLKSGEIKYQERKPAKPVWRILVLDEASNRLHTRIFPTQPSPAEIERTIMGVLELEDRKPASSHIVIPDTVEKLCPGLRQTLFSQGAKVFLPNHGFASGSRAGAEWEKSVFLLRWKLEGVREAMASCEEIAAVSGNPFGIVTSDLWQRDKTDNSRFDFARGLADKIARVRGRDPEVGRRLRNNELRGAPLNRGGEAQPPQDALIELLADPNRYLGTQRWGRSIWDIVLRLKKIRDAEPEQRPALLVELGASAVRHQIDALQKESGYFDDFLSSLGGRLGDRALGYQVSVGMKEAFKKLIPFDDRLLQVSCARVMVRYPEGVADWSLRAIPAHHHLEKMLEGISGGHVTVIPELVDIAQKIYYHPSPPFFLRTSAFFRPPYRSFRTPFSPAQCLIPTAKAGSQRFDGLLLVVAVFPRDTSKCVCLGDVALAERLTEQVNERLLRTGKGITCSIGPLQMYGEVMEIGDPP